MASQKSKRRSRKRRSPVPAHQAAPSSSRRDQRAERQALSQREPPVRQRRPGPAGVRPPSPFGGLPISEFAILVGGVALVVGIIRGGGPAVIVGIVVCALGVLEVTAREHFAGYRSHTMLLAAFPAVGLEVAAVAAFGEPRQRALVLLVIVPVYAVGFWLLRRRFEVARQTRLSRPPAP
jgi:Flp pilus assembly protein TadB